MTGSGLIYCLVTGAAFLLFVAVIILAIKKRPAPAPAAREPLGYVTEFTQDEKGLRVSGVLTDAGVEMMSRGESIDISFGFNKDGMLKDASVIDPRPCKGGNTNICVAEGCYREACVKRWLTKQP